MVLAPPPLRARRAALAWVVASLGVLVLPGALERAGAVVDDESLRIPALFFVLGLALVLAPGRRSPPGRLGVLVVLGLLLGLPIFLHPQSPASTVGSPWLFAALVGAVLLAGRRLAAREEADAVGDALALAASIAAVWVGVEWTRGLPAVGPFGRAGVAGPTLAALLPFALRAGERRAAWVGVAIPALLLGAIAATGSRTGLAAAVVAVGVVNALEPKDAVRRWVVVATTAGLLAVVAWVVWSGGGGSSAGLSRTDTVRVRAGLGSASVALIGERPLRGHGPYGFPAEVLRVRDLDEARISGGRRPFAAHADPLHFAVEGGVVAGLAVLAFFGVAVLAGGRRARSTAEGPERSRLAMAAASVAAVAVASLGEDPLLAAPTVAVLGLAAGIAAGPGPERPAAPWASAATRLAGVVLLALALLHVRALASSPEERLEDGSFRASEVVRDRAYRVAASLARAGRFDAARESYERLLRRDPGATEARLDVAETHRVEGRTLEAERVLRDARVHDPTRFDVPHRLGHLALGDEVPPSRRDPSADPTAALRLYNEAAALAPGRFETHVAYARVHRRRGDLAKCGAALRAAADAAKARGQGVQGELLLESFRLAEAEGSARRATLGILALALRAGPEAGETVRREAVECLDAAETPGREPPDGTARPPPSPADVEAATLRLAGLVAADVVDRAALRREAKDAVAAGRDRRALAIYLALVADPFAVVEAEVALEAREVASRVDRPLAASLAARARTLLGYETLSKGAATDAEFHFRAALSQEAERLPAYYGLARALARQDRFDEAAAALGKVLDLDPSLSARADADPDLHAVLPKVPPPNR